MTHTITVTRTANGYIADLSKANNADEVIALFDSHVIPTAFTSHAQPGVVRAEIERLNPGHIVIMM